MITQDDMERSGFVKDFAGPGGYPRYTHSAHGITALRRPWMSDEKWQQEMAWAIRKVELSSTPETEGKDK